MFAFRELSLKLVSLFSDPGIVNIALLESGDDLGELLLLESLQSYQDYRRKCDVRGGAHGEGDF